jgi:radical SAM protein with 4Fe4S-binding SPASM domain
MEQKIIWKKMGSNQLVANKDKPLLPNPYVFSAPTVVNLEITDVCNIKCRHCYNFWREDGDAKTSMTKYTMDKLIDKFVEAGIFHVVLTGGEPFAKFDLLEYGFKRLTKNNISISCNSNLMLATEDRMRRLADAGLDHILTSLTSYDKATNDYMVHREGAFEKIVKGIETTVRSGIRVSVNMVVAQRNKDHVYDTGKFVHELGCQKIFGTRTVPSVNLENAHDTEFEITKEDAKHTLDQLVRVKNDTGIMIGTLVSYPLCFLGDLEKYQDFVGRGCPAQSGHVISLNANGDAHACAHEKDNYGNIFDHGIAKVYQNMIGWHDGSIRNPGCAGCDYLEICNTGCRISSMGYNRTINGPDQLMVNKEAFVKPYKLVHDPGVYEAIKNGARFTVPKRLRFRKEAGFTLVNIRWANTITCSDEVADFLMAYQKTGLSFGISEFGEGKLEQLAKMYFKDVIESKDIICPDDKSRMGLSVNIDVLQ